MAKKQLGQMVDYYSMYGLNQSASAKDTKKRLRQIQADIRTAMSDGSLNGEEILSKLQQQNEDVVQAMKCFKNEEAKKKYDADLQAAYNANMVDVESQKLAKELFEEILTLFAKREYQQVIAKCLEQINNNTRDVRLYEYLAKSYRLIGRTQQAMDAVENGLKVENDNDRLLKIACRISADDYKDYNRAQGYINRLDGVNKSTATAEQIYLYMNFEKKDAAYQTLDQYLSENPNDQFFRQQCAYDFIGYANECYDTCEAEDGTNVSLILSEEAYHTCLEYCQKAYDLYQDENTRNELEYAKHFGEVEFNEDNRIDLRWNYLATAIYAVSCVMGIVFMSGVMSGDIREGFSLFLFGFAFFAGSLYVTLNFRKASYRPYWQIYKYIFTGEREPKERVFLILGKIISCYMRFSWWLCKVLLRLMFHISFS